LKGQIAHEEQPRELAEVPVFAQELGLVREAQRGQGFGVLLQMILNRGELDPILLLAGRDADQALQVRRHVRVVLKLDVDGHQQLHPALAGPSAHGDRRPRGLESRLELLLLHQNHRLQEEGVGLRVLCGREPGVDQRQRLVVLPELGVELCQRIGRLLLGEGIERVLGQRRLELRRGALAVALREEDVAPEAVDLRESAGRRAPRRVDIASASSNSSASKCAMVLPASHTAGQPDDQPSSVAWSCQALRRRRLGAGAISPTQASVAARRNIKRSRLGSAIGPALIRKRSTT
jgi:hypothetical protein